MTTTQTPILTETDRMVWDSIVQNCLPQSPYYLWSQVMDLARQKVGMSVVYRGDAWQAKVVATAEAILTELGVAWEIHAGCRYIGAKRVYWDGIKGRWAQDDYRPA